MERNSETKWETEWGKTERKPKKNPCCVDVWIKNRKNKSMLRAELIEVGRRKQIRQSGRKRGEAKPDLCCDKNKWEHKLEDNAGKKMGKIKTEDMVR